MEELNFWPIFEQVTPSRSTGEGGKAAPRALKGPKYAGSDRINIPPFCFVLLSIFALLILFYSMMTDETRFDPKDELKASKRVKRRAAN